MAANIRLKKSSVAGKEPISGDLDYGELALNYADGVLYYKNTDNIIANISGGGAETDSAAPSGGSLRDGGLWWDAINGRLKVYYDDGSPSSTPITVAMNVNSTYTTNGHYEFDTGWTDRNGLKSYVANTAAAQDPDINIQAGDTITITNNEFGNHPLFFITQTAGDGSYDAAYNVELPATNYGGGTVTVSYQFNSPGIFYYICGVHKLMIGTITVVASDTASKQWVDASPQGRGYTGSAGAIGYTDTAPANPAGGQIWYDTKTGKAYMYYIVSGYGHWVLFSDPTISDGNEGFTGSKGYTGSRGSLSPRSLIFNSPQVTDEQTLLFTASGLTVSQIRCVIRDGTDVDFALKYATSRNLAGTTIASGTVNNSSTGALLAIADGVIPTNSYVWGEVTAVTGVVTEFHVNIIFSE